MSVFQGFEHIVREQEPLAPHTWLHLGGPAEYFAEPTSVDELAGLVKRCAEHNMNVRVLGGGSRLLVPDAGVAGLVVQTSAPEFCEITVDGNNITSGGGAKLGHLIATSVREGLAGLESLVGIPGTVAGALRGNAHSSGSSIGQWTTAATVMTRQAEVKTRNRDDLRFSYGDSNLDELAVLSAVFTLEPGDSAELTRRMQKAWIVKKASQPTSVHGISRVFKDPQGLAVAELLDQVGLRGEQIGGARVAETCSNFIEVTPPATSEDVVRLIELMRSKVQTELGVDLECELEIW